LKTGQREKGREKREGNSEEERRVKSVLVSGENRGKQGSQLLTSGKRAMRQSSLNEETARTKKDRTIAKLDLRRGK